MPAEVEGMELKLRKQFPVFGEIFSNDNPRTIQIWGSECWVTANPYRVLLILQR